MQCACIAALLVTMQEVIEEVQQQATAEGAFGRGTTRYLDPARPDVQLPTGAAWSTVKVRSACFGFLRVFAHAAA